MPVTRVADGYRKFVLVNLRRTHRAIQVELASLLPHCQPVWLTFPPVYLPWSLHTNIRERPGCLNQGEDSIFSISSAEFSIVRRREPCRTLGRG
jgi:hypothetical protein